MLVRSARPASDRRADRRDRRPDLRDHSRRNTHKGFLVGVTEGPVLYESDYLVARAPSTAQLLAMKLAAWRDAIDRDDARLLLSKMAGSMQEVWVAIEPSVPAPQRDKASYAFEDLWEAIHGSA